MANKKNPSTQAVGRGLTGAYAIAKAKRKRTVNELAKAAKAGKPYGKEWVARNEASYEKGKLANKIVKNRYKRDGR